VTQYCSPSSVIVIIIDKSKIVICVS
jgi:hypothetical protein